MHIKRYNSIIKVESETCRFLYHIVCVVAKAPKILSFHVFTEVCGKIQTIRHVWFHIMGLSISQSDRKSVVNIRCGNLRWLIHHIQFDNGAHFVTNKVPYGSADFRKRQSVNCHIRDCKCCAI
ncbi:hypothetical protein TNIN_6241 [Trichonephila inaurata madagascariensis]|uniref:Uncharacterized protein n=1 Tax=Trichonephila inaurata madagascariensis TaxID=2747483 RepID=A0A8X6WTD7_9ARAC|nr:hypothetical protein TNIN_6241 [Trichonephila inaurata madagascariensis]